MEGSELTSETTVPAAAGPVRKTVKFAGVPAVMLFGKKLTPLTPTGNTVMPAPMRVLL